LRTGKIGGMYIRRMAKRAMCQIAPAEIGIMNQYTVINKISHAMITGQNLKLSSHVCLLSKYN
jgi:hypothetical protein